jgi:hypothetical protein
MPNKRFKSEQIVTQLRQLEVSVANRKTTLQARKESQGVVTYAHSSR